eukprot:TRINITY_DN3427_c0_g1_i1.p1 TRINITY_DN3427_c0_g1~~TRINITY_DN3427_c0_g1_i1.p1  ORF type:complete len:178 (+),score=65.63 TRINITY_DN3427_c0_g1_i1:458-991(+)
MINIVEQNDRFDLRIDNQSFSNLYLEEKTKQNFKYEVSGALPKDDSVSDAKKQIKDFPFAEEVKKGGKKAGWKEETKADFEDVKPVKQKQVNLLDVFDEPVNAQGEKSAPVPSDLLNMNFEQPNEKPAVLDGFEDLSTAPTVSKGVPSFGSSKPSFGSGKSSQTKNADEFFACDFQF